jgi:hypothetical protein
MSAIYLRSDEKSEKYDYPKMFMFWFGAVTPIGILRFLTIRCNMRCSK